MYSIGLLSSNKQISRIFKECPQTRRASALSSSARPVSNPTSEIDQGAWPQASPSHKDQATFPTLNPRGLDQKLFKVSCSVSD